MTMPTTIGTGPAGDANPIPRSSHQRTTPSQDAKPNADPPVSTTAFTSDTVLLGSSSAHSRVPGAPPRTSPDATVPDGNSTTVHPVRPAASLQCPTRTPATSVTPPGAEAAPVPVIPRRTPGGPC